MKQFSILLADDHAILRQGIGALLNSSGHFIIIGEAQDGREAVRMFHLLQPELILMDIAMPVLNGLEATRQILGKDPKAKIVILSAHTDDEYVTYMTNAGVSGFLKKQTSAEILTHALLEVVSGRVFFAPSLAKAKRPPSGLRQPEVLEGFTKAHRTRLTLQESEVLQLAAEGSTNKRSAAELGVSLKTIEKRRQNLMDKLEIHDPARLVRYAMSTGIIRGSVRLTIT